MASNEVTDADVIPSSKIKEAYEICMKDPRLEEYFNAAPMGARQYIALMFYCTIFSHELTDELRAKYQTEVEEELTREDVLYLAENEMDPVSKTHFRRLYVAMSKADATEALARAKSVAVAPQQHSQFKTDSMPDLEPQLTEIFAELQMLRRLVTAMATRKSGIFGFWALGILAYLLLCMSVGPLADYIEKDWALTVLLLFIVIVPIWVGLFVGNVREQRFHEKIRKICEIRERVIVKDED